MIKKTLLVISLVMSSWLHAADNEAITLTFNDGTQSALLLNEKPSLTFVGKYVTISTVSSTLTVERSMLQGFHVGADEDGIRQLSGTEVRMVSTDCFALPGNADVRVCDMAGVTVEGRVYRQDGHVIVDLSRLVKGNYVIRVNKDNSIKYQKR